MPTAEKPSVVSSSREFFPFVKKICYEGRDSKNPLSFKHYDENKIVGGKTMKDHLRFAVCFWHTFCSAKGDPFGPGTQNFPWQDSSNDMRRAEDRLNAAFEFFTKLGVPYYCFHDRDISPEGDTISQSEKNLSHLVSLAKEKQKETGVKLLWDTANLFSHPRYMNGAATNPDFSVVAHAAAQVKAALDAAKELGAENYVFWGGREGYECLLNTNMKREREHMARFFHMAKDYARKIGFDGQFLIEPKPKEPMKHQYDFDAATVIGFLREFGLTDVFKLNIEANHATLAGHTFAHELQTAADAGLLGSIDANRGDPLLGWDTDQFPMDVQDLTEALLVVLEAGGLGRGGLNFDAKTRRNSTDLEDMFHAHIGGMDAFARALISAHDILEKSDYKKFRAERYASYDKGDGARYEKGELSFEDLRNIAEKSGEPRRISGKQELLENFLNQYV